MVLKKSNGYNGCLSPKTKKKIKKRLDKWLSSLSESCPEGIVSRTPISLTSQSQ